MSDSSLPILDAARNFAEEILAPNATRWELDRRLPREAFTAAAERDLCRLIVEPQHGGLGLGVADMIAVMRILAGADMAVAFGLVVHNNLAGNISRNGSPAQVERYLPDMIAGRKIGAFLLTEPTGGSDAAAITTAAARTGGKWLLDGEKAWVSNAAQADVLSVYAQSNAPAGWRGITSFLVDRTTPGVTLVGPYELMGGHALGTGGFQFKACEVSDEALLQGPGDAFKGAMAGIDLARVNVAAMCAGMLEASLSTACQRAQERQAFGHAIADFQGVQWQLADVATDLHATTLMTAHAAAQLDAGVPSAVEAAHAKKFATRVALPGITQCMQAMGADGFKHDTALARHLAGAKMAQYLDGTTEIQNVVISRSLFA